MTLTVEWLQGTGLARPSVAADRDQTPRDVHVSKQLCEYSPCFVTRVCVHCVRFESREFPARYGHSWLWTRVEVSHRGVAREILAEITYTKTNRINETKEIVRIRNVKNSHTKHIRVD